MDDKHKYSTREWMIRNGMSEDEADNLMYSLNPDYRRPMKENDWLQVIIIGLVILLFIVGGGLTS